MSKISIGLRGWRFEEEEVFTEDGGVVPFDEMDEDTKKRLVRLGVLYGAPCDACWLIHGDDNLDDCNESTVVYGEPLAEVTVCDEHEPDFLYWFREEGGIEHAETKAFDDEFHEWFVDGGRAPEDYGGMEHVDTDPVDLPKPKLPDPSDLGDHAGVDDGKPKERIDIRNLEISKEYPTRDT
ncbi:hypothetical protein [Haloarchaeobius sp. TZWWS8]|uniref:hypothetical protein n=1 Tax=Haloarchaeobius sp. TZWWS8 TaxID=3446121 RepID=UPI003EBD1A98